jgi:hypothetical protein
MTEQRLKVGPGPPEHTPTDPGPGRTPSEAEPPPAAQPNDRASAWGDEPATQIGRQFDAQAEALDGVAEELRRQGKEGPAKVAEQAAKRVKDVGSYLERSDAGSVVGAAADRLLKASRPDDPPEEDQQPGGPGAGAT